jgi:GT2 family glycosyltransferase
MGILIYTIIVTHNGISCIEKCIKSLLNSTVKNKILIIDNASSDGTVELIKNFFPEIEIIELGDNIGFGKANNIGLNIAIKDNADYIFLINQDAYVESDTIEELINFSKLFNKYGIISPVHLNKNSDGLDKNFSYYVDEQSLIDIKNKVKQNILFKEVDFVNAAAWLITKECLKIVGGFDPIFSHYGEDRDYCNRVKFCGFKICVYFKAFIYHDRFYKENNLYKKNINMLYTSAIAHLKDPNKNLYYSYFGWFFTRIKKIFKYLILFKFKKIIDEIYVEYLIIKNFKQLKKHRSYCMKTRCPFLN